MTDETKERKRQEFKVYLGRLLHGVIEQEDTIELHIPTRESKHLFYFIGLSKLVVYLSDIF
jgi:hypothetical protein